MVLLFVVMQATRAVRVLRFQNPTLFLFNVVTVWFLGMVASSLLSGRTTLLCLFYGALLYPGFARRRILEKLRDVLCLLCFLFVNTIQGLSTNFG